MLKHKILLIIGKGYITLLYLRTSDINFVFKAKISPHYSLRPVYLSATKTPVKEIKQIIIDALRR